MKQIEAMKRAAGKRAVEILHDGMVVGLGSGSTVALFIEMLGKRCQEGLRIKAVASSQMTQDLAKQHQIPLIAIDDVEKIDITIDGADEIDPNKCLIKGGGAALLREKILAALSVELIIIADETKKVELLGRFPLSLEIVPFGRLATEKLLDKKAYPGNFRLNDDGSLLITENGNYIFDVISDRLFLSPKEDEKKLLSIPGVVETGFFIGYAGRVIIGQKDGTVELID